MEKMDTLSIFFTVAMIIFIGGSFYVLYREYKKSKKKKQLQAQSGTVQMQLQAYERLTLLADRIALQNLVAKLGGQAGFTAREMQLLLTQHIKQEFEYNITQQIYVSEDAWTSIKNLKEQNLLVVNQLAQMLPLDAAGPDLCKLILEFLMNDRRGTLHELVSEVLRFEAKKLL